jgi:4-diphosphocytidyl-2-C-methyl-D-erythritol kinase
MVVFPNAKINLGLNIVEKRSDGFHNLETVFLPIALNDILEIIINANAFEDVGFSSSGLIIDTTNQNNLCVKAYHLLKQDYDLPAIKMHLHKQIPMGAGLGGGSADAAFTLQLLNTKFNLQITEEKLLEYALVLGSDCPFFIINKPCFATSRGEELQPIEMDLTNYKILIVNPRIHISTAQAFTNIKPSKPSISIKEIIQQPITSWVNNLVNDFEKPIFNVYPSLQNIKDTLYAKGAVYAAMSGTGSTFFGIFNKDFDEDNISFEEHFFVRWVR